MSFSSPSTSPVILFLRPVNHPLIDVAVEVLPEAVAVGVTLNASCPRVDVLSFGWSVSVDRMVNVAHCDDVIVFHEAWFVTCEEA